MTEVIWARLLGFLLTDGCLYYGKKNHYYEVSFSVGQQEDVKELSDDLTFLGYIPRVQFQEKNIHFGERLVHIKVFRMKCCSKILFSKFVELGAPVGDKSLQSCVVPAWIMEGSQNIKRAFLSGIIGGDGAKVTMRLSNRTSKLPCNTAHINDFEFYKDTAQIEGGLRYAEQLACLFREQNVQVKSIFFKGAFLRKAGGISSSIHLSFSNSFENCLSYGNLGFAYAKQKRDSSRLVLEFIEQLMQLRRNWVELHAKAVNLYNAGRSVTEVANHLGLNAVTVFGWLKYGKRPTVGYHKLKFGETNVTSNNSELSKRSITE